MSKHIGSKFDDFLDEEGLLAEAEAVAAKRGQIICSYAAETGYICTCINIQVEV